MSTEVLFDLVSLRAITEGDEQIEAEFSQLFIATAEQCLEDIESKLATPDVQVFVQAVHRLSGAAANMQARPLMRLCRDIERGASPDEAGRVVQLSSIRQAYAELLPEVQKLLK